MFQRKSARFLMLLVSGILLALMIGALVINTAGADGVMLPWDTPPKYRIVYLVGAEPMPEAHLVGPDKLQKTLGARTVSSWSQVMGLDRKKPLDALVIHKNALGLVNKPELINLYQRGVAVAVINVDAFKTAALLDDSCIGENDQGTRNHNGTYAIISAHVILGSPEDVALIKSVGSNCGSKFVPGVKGKTQEIVGHTTKAITNVSDYNIFAQEVIHDIEWIQFNRNDFAAQQ